MKRIYKRISVLMVLIFGALFAKNSPVKATSLKGNDISNRVNKIRTVLHQNIKAGNTIEVSGNDVLNKNLSEWVNWGNWGNWNNWNNWRDWNNWGNWANWSNF